MNTNFIDAQIDAISIHWIGNKAGDEGVIISKKYPYTERIEQFNDPLLCVGI